MRVAGSPKFRQFPITVDCWVKLDDKNPYQILVANETKSSATELRPRITVTVPEM